MLWWIVCMSFSATFGYSVFWISSPKLFRTNSTFKYLVCSLICSQVTFFLKAKKPKKVDGLHHSNGIGLRSQTIARMTELFISWKSSITFKFFCFLYNRARDYEQKVKVISGMSIFRDSGDLMYYKILPFHSEFPIKRTLISND